jgi:membrane-bound ClpP family serine protease
MNSQNSANEYTTNKWVRNGWYWRFVGLTVLSIAALQIVLKLTLKYDLVQSLPLALLVVSYIILPRVEERKLGNAIAGVVAMFIVNLVLLPTFELDLMKQVWQAHIFWQFAALNLLLPLLLGLVMAYFYLRLTQWSERKRAELEAKRRASAEPEQRPVRRHHRKKKKKKR